MERTTSKLEHLVSNPIVVFNKICIIKKKRKKKIRDKNSYSCFSTLV